MKKKYVIAAAALAFAAVLTAPPLAAAADPLPPGGTFVVGGEALWQFDDYGISYAWDAGNVYFTSGHIWYPGYYYEDPNYLISCPDPATNVVATTEPNGDVTVDCATWEITGHPGVFATQQIRLFGTENNGYLARQLVTIDNTTASAVDFSGLFAYWYPERVRVGTFSFLTDSGSTDVVAPEDAWFIAGSSSGDSVIWSSAWAKPGSTASAGLVAGGSGSDYVEVDYSAAPIPANTTANFLQYTNMVIPTAKDGPSAAIALAAASAQSAEFSTFCGRIVDGLDQDAQFVGWGSPADCNPVLPASSPMLPASGPATGSSAVAAGAVAAALIGTWCLGSAVLTARRRRAPTTIS